MISLLLFLLACTDGKPDGTDPTGTRSTITPVPVDADQDGAALPEDCDDADPTRYPGAAEACNGVDDDCDGAVDEDLPLIAWYPDADGDGWGVPEGALEACAAPPTYVANAEDCDDGAADVHPDALDLPGDGLDADCDGDFTCEVLVVYEGDLYLGDETAEADALAFCEKYNAVEGDVIIGETSFRDLNALDCLCDVSLRLYAVQNPLLENFSGMGRLVHAGEGVWVEDNPALPDLEGLGGVQWLGGIVVVDSPALTSLTGMDRLKYTEGVYVENAGITSLAGLEGLEEPVEWLYLLAADSLITLQGMPEFEHIDEVYVSPDHLRDLIALRRLRSAVWVNVEDIQDLTSFADLSALSEIEDDFDLHNFSLPDLAGLENLRSIGGRFYVTVNSFRGLDNLEYVGALSVSGNMTSFEPLQLTTVPGGVELYGCLSLTSFAGLDLLESVGGSVELGRLEPIDNVDALAALRTIGGYLAIYDTTLTSLAGLHGLESVGGDVYVGYNPYLPDSEVDALVEAIGRENIGGEVIVEENGGEL